MKQWYSEIQNMAQPVTQVAAEPLLQKAGSSTPWSVWLQDGCWYVQDVDGQVQQVQAVDLSTNQEDLLALVVSGTAVLLFAEGQPCGLLTSTILLQALLTERELLRATLDALLHVTNEAVTIIDDNSVVQGWNEKAQELYKIAREDILAKNINDFFTSLVVTKQLRTLLSEPEMVRDKYHQPVLGTHVMINAAPIVSQGKVVGAISSEREITQNIRLANELARSNSQLRTLQSEISKINRPETDAFSHIYGQSEVLMEAVEMAKRLAPANVSILLRGESGTGKELFAEAIHKSSSRSKKPFVVINCGAIPATLFESELFGYLPGSFTGADRKGRKGKFDEANQGTIFLDEIGELSLDLQVKLLRVLQNQVFYRVGGGEPIAVDVRVISATHRDLEAMIQEGSFREDLYYRINVVALEIPPLRERKEDISQLINLFVREFCTKLNIPVKLIEPEVINYLLNYHWPGNIRELRNVAERLVVLADGPQIKTEHLPAPLRDPNQQVIGMAEQGLLQQTGYREKEIILQALDQTLGDRSKAAKLLGIPRSTLYYKLKKHGIEQKQM